MTCDATRTATLERCTSETSVKVTLALDGSGRADISSGVGFLDHMLEQLARHGSMDLMVQATGDRHVDDHHTVEDVGIVLGRTFRQAIGDGSGVRRYGHAVVPMDEALVLCALDISGRGMLVCDLPFRGEKIGSFATELVPEFLRALAHNAGITLHVRALSGSNSHHIAEAAFKALAQALRSAKERIAGSAGVPSTKGVL